MAHWGQVLNWLIYVFFRNHWHIYIVNPAKCHFESDWFDRSTIHFHNSSQFMEKEIECVILTHNDIILVI